MLTACKQDSKSTWSLGLTFLQFMRNRTFHSGMKMVSYKAVFQMCQKLDLQSFVA